MEVPLELVFGDPHVTTWNTTYNTTRGPTVETRTRQWTEIFAQPNRPKADTAGAR